MEYLLDGRQMKAIDSYSIQTVGIPSMVLMERAALAVSGFIRSCVISDSNTQRGLRAQTAEAAAEKYRVLCVCGGGNNGADGLAAARQLMQAGFYVEVLLAGENAQTPEFEAQQNILSKMGLHFSNNVQMDEYDFIVDAIFGIGLSREVTGNYAAVIEQINAAGAVNPALQVVAVDIPSGIHAQTGQVMGHAVRASHTVTFGFRKLGMALYPGRDYAGEIVVADIGFALIKHPEHPAKIPAYTYSKKDLCRVPMRESEANKGSCGKVLIVAGSDHMGGAACMSAAAAYRSGCGLVRVFTHENNRVPLLCHVPEAIVETYVCTSDTKQQEVYRERLAAACAWADCIVAGPGLSTTAFAEGLFETVLANSSQASLVIDADALNLIARSLTLRKKLAALETNVVLTPHVGEMARLVGKDIAAVKKAAVSLAQALAQELSSVCVLKDAATVVTDGSDTYINTSGNCGMATAGAGDVLTGVLAGMLTAGFSDFKEAVNMAVYIHGLAGDAGCERLGAYGMKAWDIVEAIPQVIKQCSKGGTENE